MRLYWQCLSCATEFDGRLECPKCGRDAFGPPTAGVVTREQIDAAIEESLIDPIDRDADTAKRYEDAVGHEIARIVLGHSTLDVTRVYVEDDLKKAAEAIRKSG